MSKKRLIASFVAVVVLLAIGGVVKLLLLVLPPAPGEVPVEASAAESFEDEALKLEVQLPTGDEIHAASLVGSGAIVLDGEPLQRDAAEEIVAAAGPFTHAVDFIDQRNVLSSGCEIVSLAVALRAEGYDADPVEIADDHLRLGGDFTVDFVGSPRGNGGGFPACIVDAGNSWLEERKASAHAVDLTGTTFQGVGELVALGYPVLTWTTEHMVDPVPSGTAQGDLRWYDFEHCVVVYGIEGDEVLVADSLDGLVRRDRAAFERIYKSCGNLAAFVQPE